MQHNSELQYVCICHRENIKSVLTAISIHSDIRLIHCCVVDLVDMNDKAGTL